MVKMTTGLVVGAAAALYLFTRKRTAMATDGTAIKLSSKHKPISVNDNEDDQVANYRIIAGRRSGMTYVPVKAGAPPGILTFPGQRGLFTRNFVQEGGILLAEIKT